jgi:hypothetical protein
MGRRPPDTEGRAAITPALAFYSEEAAIGSHAPRHDGTAYL